MRTPFTAEEIRDGCPPGRTVVTRSTAPDGSVTMETTRFVACDEEGAEIAWSAAAPDGTTTAAAPQRSSWEDLRLHAAFPPDRTTHELVTIETALGVSTCHHYRVERGDSVMDLWFATDRPGMPIMTRHSAPDGAVATTEVVSDDS